MPSPNQSENESRYREIVEDQTELVCRYDVNLQITFANGAYCKSHGLPCAELIGQPVLDKIPMADHERAIAHVRSLTLENPMAISVHDSIQADGSVRCFEWKDRAIFNKQGVIVEYQAVGRDITEQKRAEKALITSEKRYRQLFELHDLPKLLIEPKTARIVDANLAASHFYGYDKDTLKTLCFYDLCLSSRRHALEVLSSISCAEITSYEFAQCNSLGQACHVEIFAGVIEIDNEPIIHCIVTDITEKRLAQASLQEANEFLEHRVSVRTAELERIKNRIETIFNHSGDGILLLDTKRGIQQTNYAFNSLFRSQPDQYFGESLLVLFSEENASDVMSALTDVINTQQSRHIESNAVRTDGTLFPVHISISSVQVANADIENIVCIIRDISELKITIGALQKSEARNRWLLDTMQGGFAVHDKDDRFVYVNDRLCQMLGYTRDEIIGTHSTRYLDVDSRMVLETQLALREQGENATYELVINRKNGTKLIALVSASTLLNDAAEFDGSFTLLVDISVQKEAELHLQKTLERERELNELKSRFVSMTSHEFRTPLAVILTTSETIAMYRDRMTEQQVNERLAKISRQVMHLKGIMEDALELSHMQTGHVEFKPTSQDMNALCKEIVEDFESQRAFMGRVFYMCDNPPVDFLFDERLMRQVISNLLSNALKYSPAEKSVDVSLHHSNDSVTLSVKDEGIGIPPDELPYLFAPFHRATNVGQISGTGLGLSIAKSAIELHGGMIKTEGGVGVGMTFTVEIPKTNRREE